MKRHLLFILFSLLIINCKAQKTSINCQNTIIPSLENSFQFPQNEIAKDTLVKKIKLIFEQKFDDSVLVFMDDKLINNSKIITNSTLGASTNSLTLDYKAYATIPKITLALVSNKASCVSFYPVHGKRIAYINFIKESWDIEMSNVFREYR